MFWEWFDVEISPTLIDLTGEDEQDIQRKPEIEHETVH